MSQAHIVSILPLPSHLNVIGFLESQSLCFKLGTSDVILLRWWCEGKFNQYKNDIAALL